MRDEFYDFFSERREGKGKQERRVPLNFEAEFRPRRCLCFHHTI